MKEDGLVPNCCSEAGTSYLCPLASLELSKGASGVAEVTARCSEADEGAGAKAEYSYLCHGRLRSSVSVARWMGRSQNFTCVTQLGPEASLIFSEKLWQCWGTCPALQHPRPWMQQGSGTLRAREAAKVLPSISELPKPLRLVLWWERNSESHSPEMVISLVVYKWG